MMLQQALLSGVAASAITAHLAVAPDVPGDIIIRANKLSADLSGFPVRLNLADMGASFWEDVAIDGGNLRVLSDGIALPLDVVSFDKDGMAGEAFFKANLSSAQDNGFNVELVPDGVMTAVDAPDGRNAVWSDYDAMFSFNSLLNRNGSGIDAVLFGGASTNEYAVSSLHEVNAHQGVGYDGTYYYVFDTGSIRKYNSTWTLVASNPNALADTGTVGVNHLGDGTILNGEIFVVYELYPSGPYSNQHVAVFDITDLSFKRTYDISAQGHEVSSICYDAINGYFVITNYTDSGTNALYKYDPIDFTYLGAIPTVAITRKQGITYYDGNFYITSDGKQLHRLSLDGQTRKTVWAGSISGAMEGIESKGDGNFLILFDGSPSAIYTFAPADTLGLPGWLNLGSSGFAKVVGLPKRTVWTMGIAQVPTNVIGNGAMLSYSDNSATAQNRSSLVLRASSPYGVWNNTDTWLFDPGTLPVVGQRLRFTTTQNGVVNRKLYRNGALVATDAGVSQRPGGLGNTLFIGAEDASPGEYFIGSLNYVYLRNGELSAAWLAAEYASWEGASFYEVR